MSRALIFPDVHIPFHDKRAWEAALRVVEDVKPDFVVQLGDFADFYSVSSHAKKFRRRVAFEHELTAMRREMRNLQKAVGRGKLICLQGNHEERFERYVMENCPDLQFTLPSGDELLNLRPGRDVWVPYLSSWKHQKVTFVHDVGHAGPDATKQTLAAVGHCVVHGHSHGATVQYGGTIDGSRYVALGCGWLGDEREITYLHPAKMRNWQKGIGSVDFNAGVAWMQFHPFVKGKFWIDGKVYK